MKAFTKKLVLENGCEFLGYSCGADTERVCELVFCTAMVGYQEILSDPSCAGLMVVMTYPVIGNYGITDEDFESKSSFVGAMVVRECNDNPVTSVIPKPSRRYSRSRAYRASAVWTPA